LHRISQVEAYGKYKHTRLLGWRLPAIYCFIGEPVIKADIHTNATNLLPTDIVSSARPKLDHATDRGDIRTKNVNDHTTVGANTANTSHDETSHEKKASTPKYITALQRGQRNSRVRVYAANERHKEWHKNEIQPRRMHAHPPSHRADRSTKSCGRSKDTPKSVRS